MKTPVIVLLNSHNLELARTLSQCLSADIHGFVKNFSALQELDVTCFDDCGQHLQSLFQQGRPILAFMASGIIIRHLAPVLCNKWEEPPVLSLSSDGASIVPLLGGHHGANQLAKNIAGELSGHAAITTASECAFHTALDELPEGYKISQTQYIKPFTSALLTGEKVSIEGNAPWLEHTKLPVSDNADLKITVTHEVLAASPQRLVIHPQNLIIGIGCERGCSIDELTGLLNQTLEEHNLSPHAIAAITSIDLKADEACIAALAKHLGCPAMFYDAQTLEAQRDRLQNPSDIVFKEVGCHGVSEGAALASVGATGNLIVPKVKSARCTLAIGMADQPIQPDMLGARKRGKLSIVGMGPGAQEWCTPAADNMIAQATDLVGYTLYLELLGAKATDKTLHAFPLGREEDRVRHAMELAGQGKDVALICSGDAGIYAMATLVYELLDGNSLSDGARRIALDTAPGISALQGAAARIGAPLGHDFCTISLSDLLTRGIL